MATVRDQGKLFGEVATDGVVAINVRCTLRTQDGRRAVLASGMPVAHFAVGDAMAEAHAMVSLIELGWAGQLEVARAFGCDARTVRRQQRRYEEGGMAALGRKPGFPVGRPRLSVKRSERIGRLRSEGYSNRAIATRLGVTEKAVRKVLRRLGWTEREPSQPSLPFSGDADPNLSASARLREEPGPAAQGAGADPNLSASAAPREEPGPTAQEAGADPNLSASAALREEPGPAAQEAGADPNLSASPAEEESFTGDTDPAKRTMDRLFACLGLLDDALPLFRAGTRVPQAGVLLAVPALIGSGVLECASEIYGSIGPAFYGLRTSLLALLLMALLRIKRPEALKERCPIDLGRILGLDRAPEVKTLRRKLSRLAAFGRATDFGRALAKRRAASHGSALGFLYVDGHVRVYHGKHRLPKTHDARTRIAMPATSDYWVGDERGDPLFVITAEANAGMVKMLPIVLGEVRKLAGDRRITIVFDRGGFSPKLFAKIIADGFDVLTYRKGHWKRLARRRFQECRVTVDGADVRYSLADHEVRFGKTLTMRQVTRLSDDGHQTPILTSRRDLPVAEIAARMFARWRQENFFKYLREEYALDALIDYDVVADDPFREVPNPRWVALDKELKDARRELLEVHACYGLEAHTNLEFDRRTMRGFKTANGEIGAAIRKLTERVRSLAAQREKAPKRVPVRDTVAEAVIKLAPEKKHLSNLLKMVAYQAESELTRLVASHYARADDEGRTLVQTMLASAADLELRDGELHVRFVPLSSAHRTAALAAVCELLNATRTRFPGTNLTLRYGVQKG